MTLGEELRAVRKARGMSLKTLADKAGLSAPYLCDVEKNRRGMTHSTAERVRAALGGARIVAVPEPCGFCKGSGKSNRLGFKEAL